jgi:DNA-binding phage protein
MATPSARTIIEATGISRGHVYDIMAGRAQPSLKTALDIYDKTGAKLGLLEGLDAPTIEKLRPKAAA